MGDGKAVTTSMRAATSSSSSSNNPPRTTARRSARFQTRASTRSFIVERQPIVLQLDGTVLRAGYAEQFQPQLLIPLVVPSSSNNNNKNQHNNQSEAQWYSTLSPMIQEVYDRLMCQPATRRVVLIHPPHAPKACVDAIRQLLWNRGTPAISMFNSLELIPVALGWKRGLIVQISASEAICVVHCDGHMLEFTYQSVPDCGCQNLLLPPKKTLVREWTPQMDQQLLNENNPNSLVSAILQCLHACPVDVRPFAIGNMVFCGDGAAIFPDLGRRVAKRLEQLLEGTSEPLLATEVEGTTPTEEKEKTSGGDEEAVHISMTMTPLSIKTLKPLATRLQLTSCEPHRPDWISWIGASLWAAIWNKYDDDETRITWTFAPQD